MNCLCPLSQAVVTVLRDVRVKEYLDHQEEKLLVQDILASIETIGGVRTTRNLIQDVASKLAEFIGYNPSASGGDTGSKLTGKGIGCPGNKNGSGSSGGNGCSHNSGGGNGDCPGYQSSYKKEASMKSINSENDSTSDSGKDSWTTLAKIFLGCIPFIFSGLSYMAWYGSRTEDRVKSQTQLLGQYMRRMGYDPSVIRDGMDGDTDANGKKEDKDTPNKEGFRGLHLNKIIQDCGILGETVNGTISGMSFAGYLEAVRSKVKENGATAPKDYPLLTLNTLCTCYFRALNQPYRVHQRKPRLPRTIREILYWLSCVQYCPVFRVLVQKMQELCKRVGGDTGITFYSEKKTCVITPQNSVSYFLSAALVAPMVLLSIQDTIQSLVPEVVVQQAEASVESVDKPAASGVTPSPLTEEEKYQKRMNEILAACSKGSNGVPIHDLYSNSLFEFRFPMSETESYYLLQDCLVALFYQLYFLKQQCNWNRQNVDGDGFGWAFCRYGSEVNGDGCVSWICPQAKAASSTGGDKEKEYANTLAKHTQECGQSSNTAGAAAGGTPSASPSPLQAFLTDCLKGFTCPVVKANMETHCGKSQSDFSKNYSDCYMEFLEHRNHAGYGQYCPIPMGFRGCFKGAKGTTTGSTGTAAAGMSGLGINAIAAHYANDDLTDSCLYQVTRCISSLTRRVPRSTGTLYGFFQGIISVYSNVSGSKGGKATFKDSLDAELQLVTFGLGSSTSGGSTGSGLMDVVTKWKTSSHKTSGSCCSLDSLSGCEGRNTSNAKASCGAYLHPLTGSLYNSVATQYTDTYLSWIIHLTGVLKTGLESLQKAFRDISCKESGCKKPGENGKGGITDGECTCKNGKHGTDSTCSCHSVVHCAGVYSVFYRFGFSIHSPHSVSGHKKETKDHKDTITYDNPTKRTCHDFYKQLEKVIDGKLFDKVESCISAFLYTTRLPFGLYVTAFWLIVLLYLLWSMTVNLDLMHIRSHWKSTSSHLVPVGTLLSNASRKGFCTLGYIQEANGDRLLSEGISDVYL